jgi:hypothetical protein
MSSITGLLKLLRTLVWDLWSFSGFSCWNPTWQPNLLLFSLCWALLHCPSMWYVSKFRNANEYPIPIDASNWCPNWYLGWWTLSCSSFFSLPGIYNTYTHTHTSVLWWRSCVQYWVCHVLILTLEYPKQSLNTLIRAFPLTPGMFCGSLLVSTTSKIMCKLFLHSHT